MPSFIFQTNGEGEIDSIGQSTSIAWGLLDWGEAAGASCAERFAVFDQGKRLVSITLSASHVDVCQWVRMDK